MTCSSALPDIFRYLATLPAVVSAIKNEALKMIVNSNVRKTLERTRMVAPQPLTDEAMNMLSQGGRSPVFAGVAELIELATNPKLLSRMEPTWHPWF
jgi:transformation/transcription domain-associated protein